MTVIYSLIFVSGLVGNLSTCIVIVQNPHMHTATNYYLFNLAVSDLLTLVFGRYSAVTKGNLLHQTYICTI